MAFTVLGSSRCERCQHYKVCRYKDYISGLEYDITKMINEKGHPADMNLDISFECGFRLNPLKVIDGIPDNPPESPPLRSGD